MSADWSMVARRIRVPMGFVFAGVYIWLARPTLLSMAWSLLLVAPGLWLRGYAAGYVKKNAELTMTGPYSYTRNPLYLGSMLIAFGFAAASKSIVIVLLLAALFAIIYIPVIRSEEEFLRSKFADFDTYAARVPRLIPRVTPARVGGSIGSEIERGSFSFPLYRKHREYNALMGATAIYAVLALRVFFKH
ncbi:isoprenylcysteine carboxylmethyltransferase family protein [Alloacidobacterium dinghuense]|uniref:Isoprenylcysteine carboxylmethyltransferase family protein n=1 Tax=Alloacidobacterium dinghuense TaxID=2763107 RepID=A0A7G8BL12_9BACT|nr:isoprenylcysteine carboxylmethyltransferase family protein [Alloacidobacterium dinghuense]QNI33232.1 isoprenylcysteine carboxylmethyltransferase family protein [Alloacidobacterium dinghuense]